MNKYLSLLLLCKVGILSNVVYITEASNCSVYDESGLRTCTMNCCGIWAHAVCAKSCVGFTCDNDSQCGDGCCQEGTCKSTNCLPLRLIIAVATTAFVTFALFVIVMLIWRWLQKKRKLRTRNIARPRGHYVDMDQPYWRVKSFDPRIKFSNGRVNNGLTCNDLTVKQSPQETRNL